MSKPSVVIHWFRRDLRLTDNTALRAALEESNQVIPFYLLGDWSLAGSLRVGACLASTWLDRRLLGIG